MEKKTVKKRKHLFPGEYKIVFYRRHADRVTSSRQIFLVDYDHHAGIRQSVAIINAHDFSVSVDGRFNG